MTRVAHSLMAALAAIAVALPTISAAVPARRSVEQPAVVSDRSALIADRQQRIWAQLSGSICTGCITAANRVAPVSYDKPSLIQLAQRPPRVKTAARRVRAKVRFAQLRKRYARLQRRDHRRLAARAHPVRLARSLPRRNLALRAAPSIAWPVGLVIENRLPDRPIERPWIPQDDNRWHATILPTASMRPRRS